MIKRLKNIDLPYNKLRLQSSERNCDFDIKIFNEFLESLTQDDIKFYPNIQNLYNKIGEHYNIEHFIVGSGSDRCLEYFFQSNARNKKVLIPIPSFPMYNIYAELYGGIINNIHYETISFPIEEYIKNITKDSICIISNPSSPIGDIISREKIIEILNYGVPVLIDEAYIEFSDEESCLDLIPKYNNLYVTRTFSKGYGGAGIRLGIIVSQSQNIEKLSQFRPMYEINNFTAKWGIILLNNFNEVEKYVNEVKINRKLIYEYCEKSEIPVIYGHSNWLHIKYNKIRPENIILKENCYIPNMGNDWIRLQITNNLTDYDWIKY